MRLSCSPRKSRSRLANRRTNSAAGLALLLLAALAQAQEARVVLRWKADENAKRYQLQIARDDKFKDVVLDTTVETAGFRWDELPNVVYHWRVRSFDADDRPSQWSAPRAISASAAAPSVRAPADGASLDCRFEGVDLQVEATAVFKEYVLELSEEATFSGGVQQQKNTTGLFRAMLAPGRWHWRVHAKDVAGRDTESTPPRVVNVVLVAPKTRPTADVSLGQKEVTLAWDDVPCATRYQIEASLEGEPAVPLVANGATSGFKPQRVGDYRWRVAGLDARGAPGNFSGWTPFKVRLPGPRAGADAAGAEVWLGWASAAGATGYRVEVSAALDFKPVAAQGTTEAVTWKPPPLPPGVYLWRVSAKDSAGHWSMPSEPRRWTVPDPVAPQVPDLLEPRVGKIDRPDDGTLAASWSKVEGAARYDVQLDDGPVLVEPGVTHSWLNVVPGQHVVRLRARGPGGTPSEWGERTFIFGHATLVRLELSMANVAAGGASTTVTLRGFDEHGAPAPLAGLTARAEHGQATLPTVDGPVATLTYTPPNAAAHTDDDVLVLSMPGYTQRVKVPLGRGPLSLAVHLGGRFNAAAVSSPTLDVGLSFKPGWFSGRLAAELRLGIYAAGKVFDPAPGTTVDARVQLLPLSILLSWTQVFFDLDWRLAVGPSLQFAFIQVDRVPAFAVVPSIEASLGVGMPLGPGVLEARMGFLYGRLTSAVLLQAGGIGVTVGYRVDLPGGAH